MIHHAMGVSVLKVLREMFNATVQRLIHYRPGIFVKFHMLVALKLLVTVANILASLTEPVTLVTVVISTAETHVKSYHLVTGTLAKLSVYKLHHVLI